MLVDYCNDIGEPAEREHAHGGHEPSWDRWALNLGGLPGLFGVGSAGRPMPERLSLSRAGQAWTAARGPAANSLGPRRDYYCIRMQLVLHTDADRLLV